MQQQPLSIMLVGAPNVGKSMIFNFLTGMYVTVSNYPGTTVDVSRGKMIYDGFVGEVVDTPGIYSLIPMTDEERVTRELLCDGKPKLVIHVIDAKHIRRMSRLTLELLDGGFPVLVVLNIIDEAEGLGISIDADKLSAQLGAPVVKTSAVTGSGMDSLRQQIRQYRFNPVYQTQFDGETEQYIARVGNYIDGIATGISTRLASIMLLQGDAILLAAARKRQNGDIVRLFNEAKAKYGCGLDLKITEQRQAAVDRILAHCVARRKVRQTMLSEAVSRMSRQPATGIPIMLMVLYFGLYLFVGRFGAGVLVDYFDKVVFGTYLLPFITDLVISYIPFHTIQTLLIGEYGCVSLGLRYAVAIILPIVSTFFLAFALLEDSGYLPRLAMLLNNVCRWFGLNGRAVIPLSLGFGCGTMAVMVTRTLETNRERLLATFLLSLAIPCSAQLGVMLSVLSRNPVALLLWLVIICLSFLIAGYAANKLVPGKKSPFYMELPPLRLPRPGNVVVKAASRMVWYMREIIPVFISVSVVLWLAEQLGWIGIISENFEPVLKQLGLPAELATVFLLGFFRRDYGAAGLYDMAVSGMLDEKQLLVAAVALTLFLPCVAQLMVMVKERGLALSVLMLFLIALIAFAAAWLVHSFVNPVWLQ